MGCRHGARASRWSPLRLLRASAWPRPSRLRSPRRSPPVPSPVGWTAPPVVQPRRGVVPLWVPCSRGVLLLAVWDGVRRNPGTPLSFGIGYKTSKALGVLEGNRYKWCMKCIMKGEYFDTYFLMILKFHWATNLNLEVLPHLLQRELPLHLSWNKKRSMLGLSCMHTRASLVSSSWLTYATWGLISIKA